MNKVLFEELCIPEHDYYLDLGSGSHGQQNRRNASEIRKIFTVEKPDLVLTYGVPIQHFQ
jgi:UDP-N-acetylglucosamine 2-epimerase (non-hydrolysing)